MHPFRIAGIVLGCFAICLIALVIVGLALPGGWAAERDIAVVAPPEEIFPFINSAARWEEWTPSPDSGVELFGPMEGSGSGRRWNDPGYGQGEFIITSSELPRRVLYEVAVEGGAIRIHGQIQLEPETEGTRIRWREVGDFGWNPLLGYLAGRMEELQGEQLAASLASLRELVEGRVREPLD